MNAPMQSRIDVKEAVRAAKAFVADAATGEVRGMELTAAVTKVTSCESRQQRYASSAHSPYRRA